MSSPSSDEANNKNVSDDDEEDLQEMLKTMDIDKDFALFTQSFNITSPLSINNDGGTTDISQEQQQISEEDDGVAIATELVLDNQGNTNIHIVEEPSHCEESNTNMERIWEREEVFSSKYRPTAQELSILSQIEIDLGIKAAPNRNGKFALFRGAHQRALSQKISTELLDAWNQIAHPSDRNHPSIVLIIASCQMVHIHQKKEFQEDEQETPIQTHATLIETEFDLYLLTRGIAIVNKEKQILLNVVPWDDVMHIIEPTISKTEETSTTADVWTVVLKSGLMFEFKNTRTLSAWFDATSTTLIRFHEHRRIPNSFTLGWQYKVVHRKYFTMAVTNEIDLEDGDVVENDPNIDKLDEFNGYTPMHYAARANHISAISKLLELGANPDVPDAVDGNTPMYYCTRDGFDRAMELLQSFGAKPVSYTDDKGELFGRVAATQALMEEKRREEEKKREVEAVAAEIQQNLRLMQKRGEKIDELGNKASDLNQGAEDFASMAKQLKEKVKNRKWYQL